MIPDSPEESFTTVTRVRPGRDRAHSPSTSSSSSFGSGKHHKLPLPCRRIRHEIHKLDKFANLKQASLDEVSRSIFCISEAFRICHLLDAVRIEPADLEPLATALGKGLEHSADELILLYESFTEQTFILNVQRLTEIASAYRDGTLCPLKQFFVRVSNPEAELLPGRPEFLIKAFIDLADMLGQSAVPAKGAPLRILNLTSILNHPMGKARMMVSLAGALLCYPVVYVCDTGLDDEPDKPTSGVQAPALRQPLWLLKCFLEGRDSRNDHLLLQSTFPSSLFGLHEIDVGMDVNTPTLSNIRDRAQHFLSQKLDDSTIAEIWDELEITIEGPVLLDRVAL